MSGDGPYVLRVVGFANDERCPFAGQYLEKFTPLEEVKGQFTPDPQLAMHFATQAEAFETWRFTIGTRPDGKPDRPLTAFTVELLPLKAVDEPPLVPGADTNG